MTALWILTAILLVLCLLSLIRIGGEVEYSQDGLRVWIRAGLLRIRIFPRKPRKEKRRKKGAPPPDQLKSAEAKTEKAGGNLTLLRQCLPIFLDAANRLRKKILVGPMELRLTIPGVKDPAGSAILYGRANAWMGGLWALLNQALHVRDSSVSIRADFQAAEYTIYVKARVSLTIGQGVVLGIHIGSALLRELIRYRQMQTKNRKAA